jgi:hypothetical protein
MRYVYNIENNLREILCEDLYLMELAQDRVQLVLLVLAALNLRDLTKRSYVT